MGRGKREFVCIYKKVTEIETAKILTICFALSETLANSKGDLFGFESRGQLVDDIWGSDRR